MGCTRDSDNRWIYAGEDIPNSAYYLYGNKGDIVSIGRIVFVSDKVAYF